MLFHGTRCQQFRYGVLQALLARGLGLGARCFFAGGGCALGGGHRNGPGAYSFRLGTGLGAYFSGDLESKVLGLLEDSHVILFTSVAKMRGRQVWSALACCSSCAAVVFSGNCGHVCLCSVLCNYVSCSMAQAYMSCLRLLHSGHLLCSGVMCVSLWYLTCRIQL